MNKSPDTKRFGALFSLGNVPVNALQDYYHLMDEDTDDNTKKMIQSIFDLCSADSEHITDMASLEEQTNLSRPPIIKRCMRLVQEKLMTKGSINLNDQRRSRSIYTLNLPDKKLIQKIKEKPPEKRSHQYELSPEVFLNYTDEMLETMKIKGEWLSIFALFSAFRLSKSGKGTEGELTVPIKMGSERFTLTMRSTAGMKFMSVLDLRVLLVIISMVIDKVESGIQVQNPFALQVTDITTAMKKGTEGGDKRYVMSALERIDGTSLKITGMTDGLRGKYEGVLEVDKYFRLINGMTIMSIKDGDKKTPEMVSVTLDQSLWDRIMDKEKRFVLLVHDAVISESSPMAIRFHLWCRRVIAHRMEMQGRPWRLIDLKTEIAPGQSNTQFKNWFKTFYKTHYIQSLNHSEYSGYLFKLNGEVSVSVWPNPNDKLHQGYYKIKQAERVAKQLEQQPEK